MTPTSCFASRLLPLAIGGLAVACAGTMNAQSPKTPSASLETCEGYDALADLDMAMQRSAAFGGSSDLFYLVDADQELGYLRIAEKKLAGATSNDAVALAAQMHRFADALGKQREQMGVALATLERTGQAAEAAIEAAAMCKGVDLRDPSKIAGKEARADLEKVHAANRAKLASKACEPAQRLWSATQGADLTSDVASASIASQLTELTLPGDRGAIRDRLAAALTQHAKALREFRELAAPKAGAESEEAQALISVRSDLLKSLDAVNRTCRDPLREVKQIVGGTPEPRRATVTVRPKWSGPLADLPHAEEFGSGFVVRWREASGRLETRVVTNNHVMDGAFEAEISFGSAESDTGAKGRDKAGEKTWAATLLHESMSDDIAVLRLEPTSQDVFTEGFAFRRDPAREEEAVVAAGFPGVGSRPSFQVTKGTVSNAKFGTEGPDADPLDAYVQHTAPIDPGNSGGPLLDAHGQLLGMNTFKLIGRENVGLAIPTWRIREELIRAERPVSLDAKHAEASCNAAVAALEARYPVRAAASRFGLALYDWAMSQANDTEAASYGERFQGQPAGPADYARRRAYGAVRERVEHEKGVRPFEACSEMRAGDSPGRFVGTFHTRTGMHTLTFEEEHGAMRVVAFE